MALLCVQRLIILTLLHEPVRLLTASLPSSESGSMHAATLCSVLRQEIVAIYEAAEIMALEFEVGVVGAGSPLVLQECLLHELVLV